jgi:hypothetical protein
MPVHAPHLSFAIAVGIGSIVWEADLRYYRLGSPRREAAFAAR